MGMADLSNWEPKNDTSTHGFGWASNAPAATMLSFQNKWRVMHPSRPYAAPTCCDGARVFPIKGAWDIWRCSRCARRIAPERLHHRLMLGRNPFREPMPLKGQLKVLFKREVTVLVPYRPPNPM